MTEEEGLQIVIRRHRTSEGLKRLWPDRAGLGSGAVLPGSQRSAAASAQRHQASSNLTTVARRDVRKDIAGVAGVSTGNVTKVKQILDSVMPDVRQRLLRGEVSIHRAWQWRTLSVTGQRDALWEHLHHGAIKKTIARLVKAHADGHMPVQAVDVAATVLHGLAMYGPADLTVAVVDVPGRAVVVTRACYDELQEKYTR